MGVKKGDLMGDFSNRIVKEGRKSRKEYTILLRLCISRVEVLKNYILNSEIKEQCYGLAKKA
jgi:hypothetical protein